MSVYIKRPGQEEPELLASGGSNNSSSIDVQVIYEAMWPVGRGFIDFTNIDYSNWLGFTWERELVGMTAVGVDTTQTEFNTIGKTGGSKYTEKHAHNIFQFANSTNTKFGVVTDYGIHGGQAIAMLQSKSGYISAQQPIHSDVSNDAVRGLVQADNFGSGDSGNLQPYKVVAYWKRVA